MWNFADWCGWWVWRCSLFAVLLVLSACTIVPTALVDSASRSSSPPMSAVAPSPAIPMNSIPAMPRSFHPVDRDRLMQRLTEFSQPRFSEADREAARRYLEGVLGDRGWVVRREPFTVARDAVPALNGVNLIAELPGSDPALPALLIGAHYDTVEGSPGADDNASGAIALLEIAEVLSDAAGSVDFPRTLRLVWFDLEEFGLLGSFYHVAHLDRELYGAIVLEMLGYACDEPGCQRVPSGLAITLPDRGNFLGVVGSAETPELLAPFEAVGLASEVDRDRLGYPRVITLAVPTLLAISPNLLRSDHVPFWAEGIGALMVTDTANFRNPHYHRASDTVGTIDRGFLADSTQVVLDAAIGLLE